MGRWRCRSCRRTLPKRAPDSLCGTCFVRMLDEAERFRIFVGDCLFAAIVVVGVLLLFSPWR